MNKINKVESRKKNLKRQNKNKSPKKINEVRTKLLLFIDEENNNYLKNSNFKLNHKKPKEIVQKYFESFTVTFNNPIVHSINNNGIGNLQLGQKNVPPIKNNLMKEIDFNNFNNINSINNFNNNIFTSNLTPTNALSLLQFKSNKSVGIFYYSKYIKEIGKEFIDQRKLGVGSKKIEKDNQLLNSQSIPKNEFSNKRINKNIQIDTELSFIETLSQITSTRNRSSNQTTSKFFPGTGKDGVFKFPVDKEEIFNKLFIKKEEKEATNIQNNFNRLQDLVKKLKKTEELTGESFYDASFSFNDQEDDKFRSNVGLRKSSGCLPYVVNPVSTFNKADVNMKNKNQSDQNKNQVYNNFFKNFKKNFNEELFNILEYKGLKFDFPTKEEENLEITNKIDYACKKEENKKEFVKHANSLKDPNFIKSNPENRKIYSSLYSSEKENFRSNYVNNNHNNIFNFSNGQNSSSNKDYKDLQIENKFNNLKINVFSSSKEKHPTPKNENNKINPFSSGYRSHRNMHNIKLDILPDDQCTFVSPVDECREEEWVTTPLSIQKLGSNFFSSHNFNCNDNFSDNELELRMSNVSNDMSYLRNQMDRNTLYERSNENVSNIFYLHNTSSENQVLKLMKTNNNNNTTFNQTVITDSVNVSKCSESEDFSKFSNVSKNKSDNTISYISENSDDCSKN
jgi:hypothetical protein